jgi:hypothetical protein
MAFTWKDHIDKLHAEQFDYVDPDGNDCVASDPHIIIREDGRVEWLCEHGVGHPVGHLTHWKSWMSVHGCDGCCLRRKESV